MGSQQGAIKNAVEKDNLSTLQGEYDSLFGSATSAGQLGQSLEFDYGEGRTAPEKLAEPEGMSESE